MKTALLLIVCLMLAGCLPSAPPPVSKATHIKQVRELIMKAGGETHILNESRTLFLRFSQETNRDLLYEANDKHLEGLPGITNLGDVFTYESYQRDRIQIRIHNSHFDTYHIHLINPDLPEPAGFERIAGNVGFIEEGVTNGGH